jgi:hypothetical protein
MKCLKCDNDALVGKALCESCFAVHEANAGMEESEEWIAQTLASTRAGNRQKIRELNSDAIRRRRVKLLLTLLGLTGAMCVAAAIFVLIPEDQSPAKTAAKKESLAAKDKPKKYVFTRRKPSKPSTINLAKPAPQVSELQRLSKSEEKQPVLDSARSGESETDSTDSKKTDSKKTEAISVEVTPEAHSTPLLDSDSAEQVPLVALPTKTPTATPTVTPTTTPVEPLRE